LANWGDRDDNDTMASFYSGSGLVVLSLVLLGGCGSAVSQMAGPSEARGEVKGSVEAGARVVGEDGGSLVLGSIVEDKGDTLVVKWPTSQGSVARASVAPVVALATLKVGDRIAGTESAGDLNARIGTVAAVGEGGKGPRIKWDLDDSESTIEGGSAALLVKSLCVREKGCKYGVESASAAGAGDGKAASGFRVGGIVAAQYEIKGASYWGVGKVVEVNGGDLLVDVRGVGETKLAAKNVRLPANKDDLKPKAPMLFGKPPGGLAPGYVVRVAGDEAEMSFSEDAETGTKVKIGEEVFLAP
jgi:hypothetical protein